MSVELDRRVAEKMGWKQIDTATFNPSESERDAGLVQDRIAALGWMITIYTGPYVRAVFDDGNQVQTRIETRARCCIMRGPQDAILDSVVDVVAKTRCLAICQAFIQAMERWGDEAQN